MEQSRQKLKSKKRMMIYAFLLSTILLCIMVTVKLLPFTTLGADTTNMAIEAELEKYINYSLPRTDSDRYNLEQNAEQNSEQDTEQNLDQDSGEDSKLEEGTLLQCKVKTKIEYGERAFPVQESELIVNLGQIDGKYPYEAKAMTNEETQYDAITGTLKIHTRNQSEATYVIVGYYDTYTEDNTERELEVKVQAQAILANEEHNQIGKEEDYHIVVTENIGELTSMKADTQEIYNGYLKSNIINGTDYTTSYEQIEQIVVSKKEAQDTLEILEQNTFSQQNIDLGNDGHLVYQTTQILKSDKDRILGEEGTLEILDTDGNVMASIDANTEQDESGIFTIAYEKEPEAIRIRTSQVINEGILQIKHTKAIKGTIENVQNTNIKTTIYRKDAQPYEIVNEIKDTQTKVNIDISNTNWSNKQQNELTFAIELDASTIENNMFKNPAVQIELPSEVEKVVLDNSSIMYANGLELQEPYVATNEAGNLVIVANFAGSQTQYDENTLGLRTNLQIPATIILKKEMQSTQETVKVSYSNQYTLDDSTEIGNQEIPVQLESYQEEVVEEISEEATEEVVQGVREGEIEEDQFVSNDNNIQLLAETNPNLQLEVVPTKGNNSTIGEGGVVYEGEYIKYNIKITNTSEEDMQNVKVVASIPEGVTYGELKTQLYQFRGKYNYNFNKELTEKVINIGKVEAGRTVTTFYEVKVDDLLEGETEKQIVTSIQSYVGEQSAQSYEMTNTVQPSEVQLFMSTLIDYGGWAYGINVKSETQEEVEVKIHLPQAYKLEQILYIPQNIEDPSSYQPKGTEEDPYEEIVYTDYPYEEENPGEQNTTLKLEIDDNNVITTKLKANCFYEFTGKINTVDIEKPSELTTKVELTSYVEAIVNGNSYASNENRIEVVCPNVKVSMSSENEGEKVKYEDEINYEITIENMGGLNVSEEEFDESVVINVLDFLPEGVDPQTVTYDTWEIIYKDTETKENETELSDDEKVEQVIDRLEKRNIIEDISGEMVDEDDNKLPNVDLNIIIPKGETATIRISTTAGFVYKETEVENSAIISGDQINTKTTNTIKHTILPYNYETPENPDDPNNPTNPNNPSNPGNSEGNNANQNQGQNNSGNTNQGRDSETNYSISGMAWIDEDEDGKRTSEESVLVGITVMLVDMEDSSTVKSTTKTNNNGSYQFSNLAKGNYLVIFKYDTNQYDLTQYQKSGVDSSVNSDVSSKTITLYGEQIAVGITDTIELNASISNIDIGLIEKKACDFKIDKYINKVTIQTKSGSKQYTYDNAKLAKTEIKAKEIEGATVVVEYKMVITNEGEIAGTVNKIVDYLPNGFSFSSDLNKTWVKSENNQLINTSIANQKIAIGESVDLTLIATKKMTANATGTFTNQVAIENATSTAGVVDENTKNNTSSADVILSVSTGAVVYIVVVICILIILSVISIYFYKKGKIKIRKITKMTFLVMFTAIMILSVSSDVLGISYLKEQSFDRFEAHKFRGGPTGLGECMDHSLEAYSTNGRSDYKFSYQYMDDEATDKKESTTGDFTLKKKNHNSDVKVIESGDNYIFGPFQYNCTKSATYSVSVYNNTGGSVSGGVVCESNGTEKALSGSGNATFYVKIAKSNCSNGISKIQLQAKAKVTTTTTTSYLGKPVYKSKKVKKSQRVRTNIRIKIKTETNKKNTSVTKKIEWPVPEPILIQLGNLDIIKQDADTGARMSGVSIRVTCTSPSYDQTFTTDAEGKISLTNLPLGTYQAQELSNPYYGYTIMSSGSATVTAGTTTTITMNNQKQTGNLKISKVDLSSNVALSGVSFKIKASNGQYIKPNGEAKVVGNMLVNWLSYTTDENDATEFVTDSGGLIELHNLLTGDYQVIETSVGENIDYELDDNYISWSSNHGNGNGRVANVTVNRQLSSNTNDTTNTNVDLVIVKNKRKYIDLEGYVWLDVAENGKGAKDINGLYQDNEFDVNDRRLDNVLVQLKDIDEKTVVQLTDVDGNAYNAEVETDGGNYKFKRVEIDKLEQYYIEFNYNGMCYQSVIPQLDKDNGSKASEGSNRTDFNQNYETITKGQSNKYDLTYEVNPHTSKVLYRKDGNKNAYNYGYYQADESDEVKEERGPVSGIDEQYMIQANTLNTYGGGLNNIVSPDDIRNQGISTIGNINLGVAKREKPDLNVEKNLHKVQVHINGQTHAYNYDDRYKGTSSDKHSVDPQVKFTDKYASFSRPLYASDVHYEGEDALQVKVTYKIEIGVPNSATLTSVIHELEDYYADNYEYNEEKIAVGRTIDQYGDITGNQLEFEVVNDNVPDGYHKMKINGPIEINSEGNSKEAVIYVQLEVRQDRIVNLLGEEDKLFNITEITSYSTKQNNEPYAAIDKDSQPGNLKADDTTTFEGDTSKAPGLTLVLQDERMTSGTVFMDDVKVSTDFMENELNTGKIREGNGEYDNQEQGIEGVMVELVKADKNTGELIKNEEGQNDVALVYNQETKQWIAARTTTDENGDFMITGFIPDYYKIVYTWGGQTYIKDGTEQTIRVQEYKGTIYQEKERQEELEWYKFKPKDKRYSDAMDNYTTRTEIDNQSSMITNHNDDVIEKYKGEMHLQNGETGDIIQTIDSLTPVFRVNIEYSTEVRNDTTDEYVLNPDGSLKMNGMYVQKKDDFRNYLQNVDFGIVERAKQGLQLDNEVARVKITLANGNVLMDAKIKDGKLENEVKDTVYLPKSPQANGQIKFELDNEIIQSAQLEIEYRLRTTNISEVDYENREFYWYGTTGSGRRDQDMVNLKASEILDYIDNNISIEEENNALGNVVQEEEDKNALIQDGLLEKTTEAKELLKDTERVYKIDRFTEQLTPIETSYNETFEEESFIVNKLLSNIAIDDEMIFNNNSEIVKTVKSWGAPLITIPGNCVQNLASSSEPNPNPEDDDDEAETIIIIPPTGLNTDDIAYMMIAIISLGVLTTGIILIKKYV